MRSLSRWWLLLGCAGLAVAGLYSLVLVVARTPALASLPFFTGFFHTALVAHVDLSVLAWFLCITCVMWSLTSPGKGFMPFLEEAALISMALGMALIAVSPLTGGVALMSNYIPVIVNPVFFLGLSLLLCSVVLMIIKTVIPATRLRRSEAASASPRREAGIHTPQRSGLWIPACAGMTIIAVMAIVAFFWSYRQMPPEIDGEQYFELLFWGGGHTLQYLFTQMMMMTWLALLAKTQSRLLLILPLFALATPVAYILYDVTSQEHRLFFTHTMIAMGIVPTLLAFGILPELWRGRARDARWSALAASVLLFFYGGALGLLIEGQNVVIPAHYHGSIVGVTLAFMGLAYLLLPRFGYRDPSGWRMAYWQPVVYGIGQLLHISGLAWSGGYGVLRKTPGGLENIALNIKIALGVMGLGGLIAIIGGLMFVVVVARTLRRNN